MEVEVSQCRRQQTGEHSGMTLSPDLRSAEIHIELAPHLGQMHSEIL